MTHSADADADAGAAAVPSPVFHAESDALRFWVSMADGQVVGASMSRSVLHYRFHGAPDASDALTVYGANRQDIDDAVRRRVARGSREPVMLREHDLPLPPR